MKLYKHNKPLNLSISFLAWEERAVMDVMPNSFISRPNWLGLLIPSSCPFTVSGSLQERLNMPWPSCYTATDMPISSYDLTQQEKISPTSSWYRSELHPHKLRASVVPILTPSPLEFVLQHLKTLLATPHSPSWWHFGLTVRRWQNRNLGLTTIIVSVKLHAWLRI